MPVSFIRYIVRNASLIEFFNALCRNTPFDEFICNIIGSGCAQRVVDGSCACRTVRRSSDFHGQSILLGYMSERIEIDLLQRVRKVGGVKVKEEIDRRAYTFVSMLHEGEITGRRNGI